MQMHEHTRFRSRGLSLPISPGRRPREILFGSHRGGSCDVRQWAGRNAGKEFIEFIDFLIPLQFILSWLYFIYFVSGFALAAAARRALQFALAGRIECGSRNETLC